MKSKHFDAILSFSLFVPLLSIWIPASSFAIDKSEREMQAVEQEEFGIDSGRQKKPPVPEPVQTESQPLPDVQPEAEPERIKPIEAEEFRVTLKKSSRSGRVLLLEDKSDNQPKPGKILLIKSTSEDIAAVRVLKNYPQKFAAKIVLQFSSPRQGTEYRALKKLGDKLMALIKERERRGKNLENSKSDEDLAKEVAPDDNELDRGIPKPKPVPAKLKKAPKQTKSNAPEPLFGPNGEDLSAESVELAESDDASGLNIQEEVQLEPLNHAFSLQYASMRSVDKDANPANYNSIGVRYAYHLLKTPFLKKRTLQDFIAVEIGAFYYVITGFLKTEDNITVMPIILTARYNLVLGESLSIFGYLGYVKNNVSTGDGEILVSTENLAKSKVAGGVGAFFKLGPHWAARVDLGIDLFAIGATLKF